MKEMTEDRRTTFAVLLCIVVVMLYSEVFLAPVSRQQSQVPNLEGSAPQSPPSLGTNSVTSSPPPPSIVWNPSSAQTVPAHPTQEAFANAQTISITTPLIEATFISLGGRLKNLGLVDYKEHLNTPEAYEIITTTDGASLPLGLISGNVSDERVQYSFEVSGGQRKGDALVVSSQESATITMRGDIGNGRSLIKTVTISGNSYLMKITGQQASPLPQDPPLMIEWARLTFPKTTSKFDIENFTILSGGKISYVAPTELEKGGRSLSNVSWIGVGNRYFLSSLMANEENTTGTIAVENLDENHHLFFTRIMGSPLAVSATIFTGPKDIEILKATGHDLFRSVDLGWFSFLAHPLLALLRFFNGIFNNYGLAIIALTLLIKIGFLPLTRASFRSMKQMSEIQPEIKALRERIKDATELNQAIMKLYKDRGINPLGGCLPVFIQIPVFLGLYNALIHAIELRHAPFALWIHDLSAPEALDVFGIGVPVMVILFGASMFVQQLVTPSALDPAQKKVMLAMPVVFTFFFLGFPSGLTLYWLINNIISIVQQATLKETKRFSPMTITLFASAVIFAFGFLLTVI